MAKVFDFLFCVMYGTAAGTCLAEKNCCLLCNCRRVEIKCDVIAGCYPKTCAFAAVRDRSGRMLSAGTASAPKRKPLFWSSDTCFSRRSHRPPLTRTDEVVCSYFSYCKCINCKQLLTSFGKYTETPTGREA
jgi:hypothetical protein